MPIVGCPKGADSAISEQFPNEGERAAARRGTLRSHRRISSLPGLTPASIQSLDSGSWGSLPASEIAGPAAGRSMLEAGGNRVGSHKVGVSRIENLIRSKVHQFLRDRDKVASTPTTSTEFDEDNAAVATADSPISSPRRRLHVERFAASSVMTTLHILRLASEAVIKMPRDRKWIPNLSKEYLTWAFTQYAASAGRIGCACGAGAGFCDTSISHTSSYQLIVIVGPPPDWEESIEEKALGDGRAQSSSPLRHLRCYPCCSAHGRKIVQKLGSGSGSFLTGSGTRSGQTTTTTLTTFTSDEDVDAEATLEKGGNDKRSDGNWLPFSPRLLRKMGVLYLPLRVVSRVNEAKSLLDTAGSGARGPGKLASVASDLVEYVVHDNDLKEEVPFMEDELQQLGQASGQRLAVGPAPPSPTKGDNKRRRSVSSWFGGRIASGRKRSQRPRKMSITIFGRSKVVPDADESPMTPSHTGSQIWERVGITAAQALESVKQMEKLPMSVVPIDKLCEFGRLPRSSDNLTRIVEPDDVIVFISHRWWGAKCPDEGTIKYGLICRGLQALAKERNFDRDRIVIWIDYACIDQDDEERMTAGIDSLMSYAAQCNAMLVPVYPERKAIANFRRATHPSELRNYGERAWCRLENYGTSAFCAMLESRGRHESQRILLRLLRTR